MINDKPLIIELKSKNGNLYIYDAKTNYIFPVTKCDIDIINNYYNFTMNKLFEMFSHKYPLKQIKKSYLKITKWITNDKAFFPRINVKFKAFPSKGEFLDGFYNINQLVLNITENCNLRCRYCVYGGTYKYVRSHNKIYMNFQIAKRSIDYFNSIVNSEKRTTTSNKFRLGFYGGEPLLNFNLLKRCILYSKRLKWNTDIVFRLTTNGTLLSKKIINFLIENDVKLYISLDGPEEYHDINRVTENNHGSYNIILRKLEKIFKSNEEYYRNNIIFQAIISPFSQPEKIIDFFSNKEYILFYNKLSRLMFVNNRNTTYFDNIDPELLNAFYKLILKTKKEYINILSENLFFDEKFYSLHILHYSTYASIIKRKYIDFGKDYFMAGTCIPGHAKIFVSCAGKFYVCERVNTTPSIGDCFNGIDYKRCKKLYYKFLSDINNKCNDCSAIRFCNICFANTESGDRYDATNLCKIRQSTLPALLTEYINILEENPNAFEKMVELNKGLLEKDKEK